MYSYVGCKFKFSDKISTLDRIFVFYFVLCSNLILIILFLTTKMNREELQRKIFYSDKYYDEKYEYRHVLLPKEMVKYVPKTHLMSEDEWRTLGVQQSKGWIHYMTHSPEPHILLFKRPITESPQEN